MTVVTPRGFTVSGIVTGTPLKLGGPLGRASATSRRVTHIALAALSLFVAENGTKIGFPEADALAGPALLEHSVDLLVPPTVEGVLNEGNAARVTVRSVVRGANGPMTPAADLILADAAVLGSRHPRQRRRCHRVGRRMSADEPGPSPSRPLPVSGIVFEYGQYSMKEQGSSHASR